MFYLHNSNRLEQLVQVLSHLISEQPLSPLEKEIIVVQSKGMERWLAMQLAEQLGVWANGYFPFPETMLWRIFKEILGFLPDTSQFEREVMTWTLMDLLITLAPTPGFEALKSYLKDDAQGIKHFQLASRIADLFDQYLIYRPQLIRAWDQGEYPDDWQAILWRALTQRYHQPHWVTLQPSFFQQLNHHSTPLRLPKRLSIFGIPALPPFYLEVFAALAQLSDIHIFLLNPCQEYWGDIVSERELSYRLSQSAPLPQSIESAKNQEHLLHFGQGNSLLASLGQLGRDFIQLIHDYPVHTGDYFVDPGRASMLAWIQSDILKLQECTHPSPCPDSDRSIQIHSCHSPLREVEVLHDQLLALFEAEPQLAPKDVLVMAPDIESYTPFIQAVFATEHRIPFTIADRSWRSQSDLINSFLTLLALRNSRLTVDEVLELLEMAPIQRRFGLQAKDLELIQHWLIQSGIRWGMDAQHRQQLNLPEFEEHTWHAGLKRLLLGYVLPTDATQPRLFENILPFSALEGSEGLLLGKVLTFIEQLFETVQALITPRSLSAWADFLMQRLTDFFMADETSEPQAQHIRAVLTRLVEHSHKADFTQDVSCDVVLAYLSHHLECEPLPMPFLGGQVNFCALLPLRSVPFKVIALLGMNDQDYPRPQKNLSFDLIAQKPQRGDRSRRHNDRYLFLESLLSTRDYFYISYVGQNIRDNSVMPPSVVVSELKDYIQKWFQPVQLEAHHPLQAFSPRYFSPDSSPLFSYAQTYYQASIALARTSWCQQRTFMIQALPKTAPQTHLDIEQFIRFFQHPIRFVLTQRLGLQLPNQHPVFIPHEPFDIQGLQRYLLNQHLVAYRLAGQALLAYQPIAQAQGLLPHGQLGDYVYRQLCHQVDNFVRRLQHVNPQQTLSIQPFQMDLDGVRLSGQLGPLNDQLLIHYRCAHLRVHDHIKLWIQHLLFNSIRAQPSLLVGEQDIWHYQPVDNSLDILRQLLQWYEYGQTHLLAFFPQTALAFAESQPHEHKALKRALTQWLGNEFQPGEHQDAYLQLCFRNFELQTIVNEAFKTLALAFFQPLLAHRQKGYLRPLSQ
ncbi:MAG: exodeoxyribonuclease V subunit gamma [Pseudomonadota bacterium]|nr:exodeoxyribonuclease V subunit gamma [Pseudomonadota bacterium]